MTNLQLTPRTLQLTPQTEIQRSAVTAVQPVIDAAVMTYATPLTVPADAVAQVSFVNGASGPLVMFNRYPFTREVIIQNKSTSAAVPFRLHVAPHRYFSVHPAFGVLGRGESIAVQVTFQARPYELRDKSDVRGYLRLKRTDGVTIER